MKKMFFALFFILLYSYPIRGILALTPAEQKIEIAQEKLQKWDSDIRALNELAMAFSLRARETSDPAFYEKAEETLRKSLSLKKENLPAEKIRVWLLLGKHEFRQARAAAKRLLEKAPKDPQVLAYLTDANIETGHYHEAEVSAQQLLDVNPGLVTALTRAAYIRELIGDPEGAKELMLKALDHTPAREFEDRAWILTQTAHLDFATGQIEAAEKNLTQALSLFPDYHYALAGLAQVKLAQKKFHAAAALYQKRYEKAPHPENLYDLARAIEISGDAKSAEKTYQKFEEAARKEMKIADNSNHELVFYYVNVKKDPKEGLKIASQEIKRRGDLFTRDAYAWALLNSGEEQKAYVQILKSLEPGILDAKIYYHAGVIAKKAGKPAEAEKFFQKSLTINPFSEFAEASGREIKRGKTF